MKKTILTISILIIFISIVVFKYSNNDSPYLSISYTTYDDKEGPQGGMTTNIVLYDIKNEEIKNIEGVDYTSQYPLGIYCRADNKIYYSAENSETKGDDLFSLDLKTKEVERLTDDLFAINYIIPRKDDILLVAVKRETRGLRVISYNKLTKKVDYENLQDDDTSTWAIGINIDNSQEFYTSTFSEAQGYNNAEKASTGEADRYYYPDNTVYKYLKNYKNKEKIDFFEKQKVDAISATNKNILFTLISQLDDPKKDKTIIMDKNTKKKEEIKVENYHIGATALAPDNKTIFFIGYPYYDSGGRGVYQYDIETKQVKQIFVQEDGVGFVNNFILLNY